MIPSPLNELAGIFPVPLYLVGGAVRDGLLGNRVYDYDLASPLTPDGVFSILKGSRFKAVPNSPKLGTLKIICDNYSFEYTAFRKDSYSGSGAHDPDSVEFVGDLETDAYRRDFTVNAIYIRVPSGEIIDPTGGLNDLKAKLLRTVRKPDEVFTEDALRLLRLVRFAGQLGFAAEEKTFAAAKTCAPLVLEIAPERIVSEFDKILVSDTINGIKDSHVTALELAKETGLLELIIPEIKDSYGFAQNKKWHLFDVFGHILETVRLAPPELRLAALFHDIAKPLMKINTGSMTGHADLSAEIAWNRLTALKYPKETIERVVRLVAIHMFDKDGLLPEPERRLFVQQNADVIEDFIALRRADFSAGGLFPYESPAAELYEADYRKMLAEGAPFSLSDLPIGGAELIAEGIPEKERGSLLKKLLAAACNDLSLLERSKAIEFIRASVN